jgi:kumamolisin
MTRLCLALVGVAALVFAFSHAPGQTAQEGRKVFKDSVVILPEQPGITKHGLIVQASKPEHKTDKMDVLFALATPKDLQAKLEELVAKGKTISPKDLARDYAPKAADVEKLVGWLKDNGFTVKHTTPDRTGVYARGTVGQIEKTLEVQMVRVTRDGSTYNAARNAPSLPADIGAPVNAIIGLQPFRHAHRHSRKKTPHAGHPGSKRLLPHADPKAAPAVANQPPYLVGEILKAYNADGLPVSGVGEMIAILIDTFPNDDDLKGFWTANNLNVSLKNLEKINVKNAAPLPAPEGEETLDVEWTTGIAPGAVVRVYATSTLEFTDLDLALDKIIADLDTEPIHQLSISLGLGETFLGGPQGEVATQHDKFLRLAAAGVNVFVSTGDAGSNPDGTGHSSGGPLQAEYESSDSCVIGVGGTSLVLNDATGVTSSEEGWVGSGGGISIFFTRPDWQKGTGIADGKMRLVPDVSLAADPDRGAFVFLAGQPQQIGGTSWSAPTWAGFCALINESRTKAGMSPAGFLNPLFYQNMQAFRDITVGNNGKYDAGPGHDLVTGIGVPNVRELITVLTK